MRLTGNWRPKGFLDHLIGSYLRLADETLLLFFKAGKKILCPKMSGLGELGGLVR